MTKTEFLGELRTRLSEISTSDLLMALQYYNEIIDEYMSEGYSEESAISHLPRVEDIAEQILADTSLPRKKRIMHSQRESMHSEPERDPMRKLTPREIVLLVVLFPFLIALLLSAVVVTVSFFLLCVIAILSVYVAAFALAALACASLLYLPFPLLLHTSVPTLLLFLGIALVCGGLSIPVFHGARRLSVAFVRFCRYLFYRSIAKFRERRVVA